MRRVVVGMLALSACVGGPRDLEPTDDDPPGSSGTLVVAANGGNVASSDGRCMLSLPAGALGEDTRIEIDAVSGAFDTFTALGPVYRIKPTATTLSLAATWSCELTAEDEAQYSGSGMPLWGGLRKSGDSAELLAAGLGTSSGVVETPLLDFGFIGFAVWGEFSVASTAADSEPISPGTTRSFTISATNLLPDLGFVAYAHARSDDATVLALTAGAATASQTPTQVATGATTAAGSFVVSGESPGDATVTFVVGAAAVDAGSAYVDVVEDPLAAFFAADEHALTVPGDLSFTSIEVTLTSASGAVGVTTALAVVGQPGDVDLIDHDDLALAVSDEGLASVDADGVTGLAEGNVTVTATWRAGTDDARSDTASYQVTPKAPTAIALAISATTLVPGLATTATATVTYSDGSTASSPTGIEWSSSNQSAATVSSGSVTAVAKGTAEITATLGAIESNAVTVTVTAAATGLSAADVSVPLGSSQTITVYAVTADGNVDVTSATSCTESPSSSKFSLNGCTATAESQGSGTVKAAWNGLQDNAAVTVTAAVAAQLSLSCSATTLLVNGSTSCSAVATMTDGTQSSVTFSATWQSSDVNIATASAGSVSAKAAGTATVSATSNGVSDSEVITVQADYLVQLELTPASGSVPLGNSQSYDLQGTYASGQVVALSDDASVQWSLTPGSAATHAGAGVFDSLATGTETIKATLSGVESNTATLTVASAITAVTLTGPAGSVWSTTQIDAVGTPGDWALTDLDWNVTPATAGSMSGNLFTPVDGQTGTVTIRGALPSDSAVWDEVSVQVIAAPTLSVANGGNTVPANPEVGDADLGWCIANLTASGVDHTLEELTVTNPGTATMKVKLYRGSNEIGSEQTLSSGDSATFELSQAVAASTTQAFTVKATPLTTGEGNLTISAIAASHAMGSATVTGTVPLQCAAKTIGQAGGTVSFEANASYCNILPTGTLARAAHFTLDGGGAGTLTQIRLKNSGSESLQRIVLRSENNTTLATRNTALAQGAIADLNVSSVSIAAKTGFFLEFNATNQALLQSEVVSVSTVEGGTQDIGAELPDVFVYPATSQSGIAVLATSASLATTSAANGTTVASYWAVNPSPSVSVRLQEMQAKVRGLSNVYMRAPKFSLTERVSAGVVGVYQSRECYLRSALDGWWCEFNSSFASTPGVSGRATVSSVNELMLGACQGIALDLSQVSGIETGSYDTNVTRVIDSVSGESPGLTVSRTLSAPATSVSFKLDGPISCDAGMRTLKATLKVDSITGGPLFRGALVNVPQASWGMVTDANVTLVSRSRAYVLGGATERLDTVRYTRAKTKLDGNSTVTFNLKIASAIGRPKVRVGFDAGDAAVAPIDLNCTFGSDPALTDLTVRDLSFAGYGTTVWNPTTRVWDTNGPYAFGERSAGANEDLEVKVYINGAAPADAATLEVTLLQSGSIVARGQVAAPTETGSVFVDLFASGFLGAPLAGSYKVDAIYTDSDGIAVAKSDSSVTEALTFASQ